MMDGKAYYTLSSYDPVSIEIYVPYITDAQVDHELRVWIESAGGDANSLRRPQWLRSRFGCTTLGMLRSKVKNELEEARNEALNAHAGEQAARELARRLQQHVPASVVDEECDRLITNFTNDAGAGMQTLDDIVHSTGVTKQQLRALFREKAQEIAEQDAALLAYATAKHIRVSYADIAAYLGINLEVWKRMAVQAHERGSYEKVAKAALLSKTQAMVISSAARTVHRQTKEEAEAMEKGRRNGDGLGDEGHLQSGPGFWGEGRHRDTADRLDEDRHRDTADHRGDGGRDGKANHLGDGGRVADTGHPGTTNVTGSHKNAGTEHNSAEGEQPSDKSEPGPNAARQGKPKPGPKPNSGSKSGPKSRPKSKSAGKSDRTGTSNPASKSYRTGTSGAKVGSPTGSKEDSPADGKSTPGSASNASWKNLGPDLRLV